METENIYEKYYGKVVATRGYGSGVNVGRLVHFDPVGKVLILTESYFCRNWEYDENKSHGSMASLSGGHIEVGGTITRIHYDSIIVDCAQIVICPDKVLEICEKSAK